MIRQTGRRAVTMILMPRPKKLVRGRPRAKSRNGLRYIALQPPLAIASPPFEVAFRADLRMGGTMANVR